MICYVFPSFFQDRLIYIMELPIPEKTVFIPGRCPGRQEGGHTVIQATHKPLPDWMIVSCRLNKCVQKTKDVSQDTILESGVCKMSFIHLVQVPICYDWMVLFEYYVTSQRVSKVGKFPYITELIVFAEVVLSTHLPLRATTANLNR